MQSILDDPFDDGARDPAWTDEANNGTILEAGETLTLSIAAVTNGDWWQPNIKNASFATISPLPNAIEVITKLNNYTVNDLTNAGLIIGNTLTIANTAGTYCYSWMRARSVAGGINGLEVINVGILGSQAVNAVTTLPIWLRIRATAKSAPNTIYFDYSTDGINWINSHSITNFNWTFVGLHVKNWGPPFAALSAPFEFFTVNHLPSLFLAPGQQPLMKVEIYVAAAWINLNSLAGENYVEGANVSLGGAAMTPNPVAGTWSATLFNQDGIFHPQHPTSAFNDYLKTERLTRISIGATYGGVDYYWQRVQGYMDIPKFSVPDYKISISGGDYMKRLRETEFRHLQNYWGTTWTTSSISSDGGTGVEKYINADAMRLVGEANAVPNWVPDECTFDWVVDAGGTSVWVGRMITTEVEPLLPTVVLDPVFVPVAGTQYAFNFEYNKEVGIGASLRVVIKQKPAGADWIVLGQIEGLYSTSWPTETLYFTAQTNDAIEIWLEIYDSPLGTEYRFDKFSIFEFVPYWGRYYELRTHDANEKGVHHITLDPTTGPEDVWQGEGDEGWYYTEDAEAGPDPPAHPAGIVFFDPNKIVAVGINNLIIYYYLQQIPENVVADILVLAGLYGNQAAALTAMQFDATGITIDKVWFNVGTTYLDAIRMICERCNYRFYFSYDGVPYFKPIPTAGTAVFTFTDPKQISSISTYQDRNEIKNRIVIKGMKQAEPVNRDETMSPKLRGETNDAVSIAAYGERTLTIDNHLFQTQAVLDAMCVTLLAEYKDPKWYSTLKMDYLPVPLEMGDNIQWEERLSPTLDITQTGIIRDIKISNFGTTYKCVHT